MSKIYLFGIGGTGSRVIKALTFLLASGIEFKQKTIVPIIIDPDEANGDVTKTIDLLRNYEKIRTKLTFNNDAENHFFETSVESISENYRLKIPDSKKKFKEFINYSSLDHQNQALISLLFSEQNLNADMEVGFKGNPNMGSVVLNQFNTSEDFEKFASSFVEGDRIFIISSIFGGTGASGFPLLLKNLRSASTSLDNSELLKNSPIGAVSLLPYFGVKKEMQSAIEKSTFISKTKAALQYYEHNVTNGTINRMYYLGDNLVKDYENKEGSVDQKNDAHFLELVAALSIVDFANTPSEDLEVENGKAINSSVKEFGIQNNAENISFSDLGAETKHQLFSPLTSYFFFTLYLENEIRNTKNQPYAQDSVIGDAFLNSDYFKNVTKFNQNYLEWLSQMSKNKRAFSPFKSHTKNPNIFDLIEGSTPKKDGLFSFNKTKNYEKFTVTLNEQNKKVKKGNTEQRLFNLFYKSTTSLITEKFNS